MSRTINEQQIAQVLESVTLVSASVRRVELLGTQIIGNIEKRNADETAQASSMVEGDLGAKTVAEALADIEAATGIAPDIATLTVQDFINSLIHEIDANA